MSAAVSTINRVLGIETSCDETAVAVYDVNLGLLAHEIYSQIPLHAQYGGVVPELASRDHVRKLLPLVEKVMNDSGTRQADLDGIAYTVGPGLIGALLVGAVFGRSLAYAWQKPAVPVHHMEGHLLAPLLEADAPEFPFLALLVSGGHTLLVRVTALGDYQILGDTLDDAAGEAFDKTARLLGLSYPGGPAVAALAEKGDPARFDFPRPMTNRPGLDFSFSGLKTFVANTYYASDKSEQVKSDIARAFEEAVVDTFVIKCRRALKQTGLKRLVVAGGVSANKRLRQGLQGLVEKQACQVYFPRPEFCTDNGAMIAYAGLQHLRRGVRADNIITVRPRFGLTEV